MRRLLILTLLAACAQPATQPAAVAPAIIQTDRTRYVRQQGQFGDEITIKARFTNTTGAPVYLVNCNGAFTWGLQRQVGGRWVDAWVGATNACLSPPIVVAPGKTHEGSVIVRRGSGAVLYPRRDPEHPEPGTYRVVWHNMLSSFDPNVTPFGPDVPVERRVSPPITIE